MNAYHILIECMKLQRYISKINLINCSKNGIIPINKPKEVNICKIY